MSSSSLALLVVLSAGNALVEIEGEFGFECGLSLCEIKSVGELFMRSGVRIAGAVRSQFDFASNTCRTSFLTPRSRSPAALYGVLR